MGRKIDGKFINNLRYYADDTVIFSGIVHHKTDSQHDKKLTINNTTIKRVYSYIYLRTWINSNGHTSKEIRCRVELVKTRFFKMKKIFSNRDLSLELIIKMLKCYVLSIWSGGLDFKGSWFEEDGNISIMLYCVLCIGTNDML